MTEDGNITTTATTGYLQEVKTAPERKPWVCPLCGKANAPWVDQCPCIPSALGWGIYPPPQDNGWKPYDIIVTCQDSTNPSQGTITFRTTAEDPK